jgi:hypothetical protein
LRSESREEKGAGFPKRVIAWEIQESKAEPSHGQNHPSPSLLKVELV